MFPKILNRVRKERKYTAQQMADMLSVSLGTYRHYENGHSSPSIYTLVRIADILDVSLDVLMGREDFLARHEKEKV